MRLSTFRLLTCASLLFSLFLSNAMASTKGDWQKALRKDTIEAYEKFLQKHPDSEFTNEAKQRVDKLRFDEALQKDELPYYEKFVENYPESRFLPEAKGRITSRMTSLRSVPIRKIALRSERLGETGSQFERPLKEMLEEMGIEVTPTGSAGCDAELTLSDLKRGVTGAVSFALSIPNLGPYSSPGGTVRGTAVPTSYAVLLTVSLHHREAGAVFQKDIWGNMVGKFLGLGPDPDSEQARSLREKSLIENVELEVPTLLVTYFGAERFHSAVPALAGELKSATWSRKRAVISLLGELGTKQAVPVLVSDGLTDRRNTIREAACQALAKIRDGTAVAPLVEILKKDDAFVRKDAARALGEIGDPTGSEALIVALSDESENVRKEAADALKKITKQGFGLDKERWLEWWTKQKK